MTLVSRGRPPRHQHSGSVWFPCCDYSSARFTQAVQNQDFVIHLAGLTPYSRSPKYKKLSDYLSVNYHLTSRLAALSASANVKAFIYISSLSIYGKPRANPFTYEDVPFPEDYYGLSKHFAELSLNSHASQKTMRTIIIRAPMIYGPMMRGPLQTLAFAVKSGIPLPLGSVDNNRSLISVFNLASFIRHILSDSVPGGVHLVADPYPISTPELVSLLAYSMGLKPRLFHFPRSVLSFLLSFFPSFKLREKLLSSFFVIPSSRSAWSPPVSTLDSLKATFNSSYKLPHF